MIALGSDHGGYKLKEEVKKYLEELGLQYKDFGTYSEERTDYPIYAEKVAKAIQSGECDSGILACRCGAGMTVAANKFKGLRAATAENPEIARAAKADDDINCLVLAGDYMTTSEAINIVRNWLGTEFKGGRYQERLEMLDKIEYENMK